MHQTGSNQKDLSAVQKWAKNLSGEKRGRPKVEQREKEDNVLVKEVQHAVCNTRVPIVTVHQ